MKDARRAAVAARARLEAETRRDADPVRQRLISAAAVSGDIGRQDPEENELQEFDECQGCFYTLGRDAVRFGCGHAFCYREKCISSVIQNCPECRSPITSCTKIFGSAAGVDLAKSFADTRSQDKRPTLKKVVGRKPTKKSGVILNPHSTSQDHDSSSHDIRGPEQSMDLSFEVGESDISDESNDDESDRRRARAIRARSKSESQTAHVKSSIISLPETRTPTAPSTPAGFDTLEQNVAPAESPVFDADSEGAVRYGSSHIRVQGVVRYTAAQSKSGLYKVGTARPYDGINGDYWRSDQIRNSRAVYLKIDEPTTAIWWANNDGKDSWCVGPADKMGGEFMWAYVISMGFGPEEAGTKPWVVYSYMSGCWEEQDGIEVVNLDADERRSQFNAKAPMNRSRPQTPCPPVTRPKSPHHILELDDDGHLDLSELRRYLDAHPEVKHGDSVICIRGAVLHHEGVVQDYVGINGDYYRSDEICNGRAVYVKIGKPATAVWWANNDDKFCWCIGPASHAGESGMWAYVESEGLGLEEVGMRSWCVYSYTTGCWEEQSGVDVSRLILGPDIGGVGDSFDVPGDAEEQQNDDLNLSFDVWNDTISIASDASNDAADRKRARNLRARSKKIYTFEIEPASEEEEDEQGHEEWAQETEMALTVLQERESDALFQSQLTLTAAARISMMARQARETKAHSHGFSKREQASVGETAVRGKDLPEPALAFLDCSPDRPDSVGVDRDLALFKLQGAERMSNEDEERMNYQHTRPQVDFAKEEKPPDMTVAALALEGLQLLNSMKDDQAEQLLFMIVHSNTPLCRALVQQIGFLYGQRGRKLKLDLSNMHSRSRSVSPSSTRTSVLTFSLPPTSRGEEDSPEQAGMGAHSVLGLVWQEIGYLKPDEGVELQNRSLASALIQRLEFSREELDAFGLPDLSVDCYIEADDHMYYRPFNQQHEEGAVGNAESLDVDVEQDVGESGADEVAALKAEALTDVGGTTAKPPALATKKKSSFFSFGRKKANDSESGVQDKKKGIFGGLFSKKEEVKERVKESEMPEDAKNALAQLSQAEKLLEAPGKQTVVIKIAKNCLGQLHAHLASLKDDKTAEKLLDSLQVGIDQANRLIESAQESILKNAEVAISSCAELEGPSAIGETLHQALEQAEVARAAYSSLDMSSAESICGHKISILRVRVEADRHVRDALKKMDAGLFRAAIPLLREARRRLSAAPSDVQSQVQNLELTLTRGTIVTARFQESIDAVDQRLQHCEDKMKKLVKLGPRYFNKAQVFHGNEDPEAQPKACLLYAQAATAFFNIQEKRAEVEARRLEKMTADNVLRLALQRAQHLEIIDQYAESIALCDWLKAWLEHTHRTHDISKVEKLQLSVHRKRAFARLGACSQMCDDGLKQLKRGYAKGVQLMEMVREDFNIACNGAALGDQEEAQIAELSRRLAELQRISDEWRKAENMDQRTLYDERMSRLAEVKREMTAKGVGSERLNWDMNNALKKLADRRKYQAGMVGVQSGADKVYEEAMLELRKLRAHMQLTFDQCQDEAGRDKIKAMAAACKAELDRASMTYQDCEAFDKKTLVDNVRGDVDFELGRWVIRQDDLRAGLRELMDGRRARARAKLELEASEASAQLAQHQGPDISQVTEEDISKEIRKVDGARKVEFGLSDEFKLDFARAQIQYQEAVDTLQGADDLGKEHAVSMLQGLKKRELEFEEMVAASSSAARNLWEERAEALCRQAHKRTELYGGPSQSQFHGNVASKAPSVMRESVMASYGRSIVFRPAFDVEPMPEVKRVNGNTHEVNIRPVNERVWLSTESLYNRTPGQVALCKFSESLAPSVPTTKAQHFARPKANLSAGLVNAPESDKADYRVMPIGPADRPRPPQLSADKF